MIWDELFSDSVCRKTLDRIVGREMAWARPRTYVSDLRIEPSLTPSSAGDVVVVKGRKPRLKSMEPEVEEDAKRRDASDETSGAEWSSSKSTRNPPHGE